MKIFTRNNICTTLLCLLVASTQNHLFARDFEIVGTPQIPYKFIADGDASNANMDNLQGIDIDIIKLVMEELGVPFNISLISSGSRIIKEAEQGRVDMVISFSHKKTRTYLNYPKTSYKNVSWSFFINKKDSEKITYDSLDDLKGLVVGATKGWSYTQEFWDAGLDLSVVANDKQQLQMLYRGRIDVVPLNTVSAIYQINLDGNADKITYLPKSLKSKPYFNAFVAASDYPNKTDLMRRYDEIVSRMLADGTIDKIFDKYLKSEIVN